MKGKYLVSAIGGAVALALFAAAAVAAPGQLGRTPSSQATSSLVTNVAHMHMGGGVGPGMRMGSVGHMHGPMMGSRHTMRMFSSNHMGHHHHHHHHRRFFVVGFPYYDYYYDNSDCWWSKRRHHWVCPSY